jgi:glc operon protein GlcG
MSIKAGVAVAAALMLIAGLAQAQAPGSQTTTPPAFQSAAAPPPAPEYGMSIGVAEAKRAAAAAVAESGKIGANPMAVAIVDTGGHLVYFEKMDNTQIGSVRIAIDKARSAALFRRPTKAFEDALAGGRTAILALHGATPVEGGVPIVVGGKVVGAIGASGGTAQQDGQAAQAGANALK